MPLFDFEKKKEEIIAVFDIGSDSVGGMIIKINSESDLEIIASVRNPMNFLFDINFSAFWRCARNAVKKTASQLLKFSPAPPDKVLCVFSSPWFISQTRIISVRKDEPFEISEIFFKKLLNKEIEIFKKKRNGKISDFELIESESMKTKLNGYDTEKPFGKKAKTFKAYIYMSFGSEEVSKEIKRIISEEFGKPRIYFQTLPFVAFNIFEKIVNPEAGYLFADIGGEITDISLVRDGVLEETVSFPIGRNALVREIASRFKTTIKEADSLIERFRKGHAGVPDSEKISSIAERVIGEWSGFLRKVLVEISSEGPLPRDFFLAGSAIEGLGFVKSAKGASLSGFTVLGKPFNAHRVLPEGLKHYFKFERSFEKDKDAFLMIESLFAAKVL